MLVPVLIGLLAAAPADGLTRIPGMRLRLGMAERAVVEMGGFPEIKAPDAGSMTVRQGPARFFGLPGKATCYLDGGVLARVRFEADSVSRHSQSYVDGQLRRLSLDRRCQRDLPGDRLCDWLGRGVKVGIEMRASRLVARIEPWPSPAEPRADSLPARAQAPAPVARASAPTAPVPALRAPPAPAARPDTAARRPDVVTTLPETLTISLTSRNSPDVWPRIVSSPTLTYPEQARRESIQGVVWVLALVGPAGQVLDAWVERGLPELDPAALSWISRSRFAPCERQGNPCRFHVRVAVLFTLH